MCLVLYTRRESSTCLVQVTLVALTISFYFSCEAQVQQTPTPLWSRPRPIITLQTEICMVFVVTLLMFNATIGDFNGCAISNKSIEVKQTYHNCYYVL